MEIVEGILLLLDFIFTFNGDKSGNNKLTTGAKIVKAITKIILLIALLWAIISLSTLPVYLQFGYFLLVFAIVGIIFSVAIIVIISYCIPSLSGDKKIMFFTLFSMVLLTPLIANAINYNIVTRTYNYTIDKYSSTDENQYRICNDAKNKTACVFLKELKGLKMPVHDIKFEVCTGFFGFRFIGKVSNEESIPSVVKNKLLESGI